MGTPTVNKDLSLISLLPKWSGLESGVLLEEFFESIDGSSLIERWSEADKLQIAALKLTETAGMFYNGCPELQKENLTWQEFKIAFRGRFRDIHSDQYHFMKLQTARQGRNESPFEFADRFRGLAQKNMVKTDDPVEQRVHRENAYRILLASFVAGLTGVVVKQVRYSAPQSMQPALSLALSVQEAENQEKFNENFFPDMIIRSS
jgi:hypothetical protein